MRSKGISYKTALSETYLIGYTEVVEIYEAEPYSKWYARLRDVTARARIDLALRKCVLAGKMVGDIKPVGQSVYELRIHVGPGYRIYYCHRGTQVVLLLQGGDKSSQSRDIAKAHALAHELRGTKNGH